MVGSSQCAGWERDGDGDDGDGDDHPRARSIHVVSHLCGVVCVRKPMAPGEKTKIKRGQSFISWPTTRLFFYGGALVDLFWREKHLGS